jgi:hypothetical protein
MEIPIAPQLKEFETEVVLCVHDESIIYSNDATKTIWQLFGGSTLRPKSNGRSLHVSGFACACHGFCKSGELSAFKIIKPGKNADGYWTNKDLIEQLTGTNDGADNNGVFTLMEEMHPGKSLVFALDNSANHHASAPTGCNYKALNLGDGGKNVPLIRNSTWNGEIFNMQTPDGKQKGIKTILVERGAWIDGLLLECKNGCPSDGQLKDKCCARKLLSLQPDFKNQRPWLVEVVENRGHKIIFFPKFHCELNFIEMIWGYCKTFLRRNCSFSFQDLCVTLPHCLSEVIPLSFFKRASRHCYRFMDGYRQGFKGPLLNYIMKKYTSHRKIPDGIIAEVRAEYDKKGSANR